VTTVGMPIRSLDLSDSLSRLVDLGPPSEILANAPSVAAGALAFDTVVLSSVRSGLLRAESVHQPSGNRGRLLASLREAPVRLEYPLIEGEIMRQRRPRVVRIDTEEAGRLCAFGGVLAWLEYAAAPLLLDGQVIGFLHGERGVSERPIDDADATSLAAFALCFGIVYERAVLRHRLRVQHQEMRRMASWADTRTSELGERAITIGEDAASGDGPIVGLAAQRSESGLRDLLTRRELEVLKLMVRGETNAGIARDLVVAEGTVKYHVKNVLRKLHAANRAEATSVYLRLTLNRTHSDV
jgi:LuxR family transcriptional regulator, regulator of acetate metabolism